MTANIERCDIDADLGTCIQTDRDDNGIPYHPIQREPGCYPHPLVSMSDREDHDATWKGDAGNLSVLYGPGSWVPRDSDAAAYYGERNFWPWNVHGPLVHVPAGDVDGDVAARG